MREPSVPQLTKAIGLLSVLSGEQLQRFIDCEQIMRLVVSQPHLPAVRHAKLIDALTDDSVRRSLRERVIYGATIFDRVWADWFRHVPLAYFNMNTRLHHLRHYLGAGRIQMAVDEMVGEPFDRSRRPTQDDDVALGLIPTRTEREALVWAEAVGILLTELWTEQINLRLEMAGVAALR